MKVKTFWHVRLEINLPPVRFSAEVKREKEKEVEDKPKRDTEPRKKPR